MATSISQYTPVFLPGENLLSDREAWQATIYRVAKSQTQPKRPWVHRHEAIFTCGSSAPWELRAKVLQLPGLWGPWRRQVCRDMDCLRCRSYGPSRVFFWASCTWWSESLFSQSFPVALPVQVLRGLLCLGSFSVVWLVRHIEGPPWLWSCSEDWCISHWKMHPSWVLLCSSLRHLMDRPLCCSAARAGVWGERGYGGWLHPLAWLSSVALPPWLPGFPPPAFPTTISSPTSPQSVSLQSTAALTLGLLHNSLTPAPSRCPFHETSVPVLGMYGCKDCLILVPCRLPQISCFPLSLKCFSSDSDSCPAVYIGPLLQSPHPPRAGPVLLTLFSP